MKKLIFINGPAGVGKTTTARLLSKSVNHSACFDGDWSWMTWPWDFSDESCRIAEDNTVCVLRNFLNHSYVEYIVYSWITHRQHIAEKILERLSEKEFELIRFTLVCSDDALRDRMRKDGRLERHIDMSLRRFYLSREHDKSIHIDTTEMNIFDTVRKLRDIAKIPEHNRNNEYLIV